MNSCTCGANNPNSPLHAADCASVELRAKSALSFLRKSAEENPMTSHFYVCTDGRNPQIVFDKFKRAVGDAWLLTGETYAGCNVMLPNGSEVFFIRAEHLPHCVSEFKPASVALELTSRPEEVEAYLSKCGNATLRLVNPTNLEMV